MSVGNEKLNEKNNSVKVLKEICWIKRAIKRKIGSFLGNSNLDLFEVDEINGKLEFFVYKNDFHNKIDRFSKKW